MMSRIATSRRAPPEIQSAGRDDADSTRLRQQKNDLENAIMWMSKSRGSGFGTPQLIVLVEQSSDGGKTWTTSFDGTYIPSTGTP